MFELVLSGKVHSFLILELQPGYSLSLFFLDDFAGES